MARGADESVLLVGDHLAPRLDGLRELEDDLDGRYGLLSRLGRSRRLIRRQGDTVRRKRRRSGAHATLESGDERSRSENPLFRDRRRGRRDRLALVCVRLWLWLGTRRPADLTGPIAGPSRKHAGPRWTASSSRAAARRVRRVSEQGGGRRLHRRDARQRDRREVRDGSAGRRADGPRMSSGGRAAWSQTRTASRDRLRGLRQQSGWRRVHRRVRARHGGGHVHGPATRRRRRAFALRPCSPQCGR